MINFKVLPKYAAWSLNIFKSSYLYFPKEVELEMAVSKAY